MKVSITTAYITLGQLLKLTGLVQTGGEVKTFLETNRVLVNGNPVQQRGKKLYPGDRVVVGENVLDLSGD